MALKTLGPSPRFRAFDASGNPLAGGKLYTYAAGTTTQQATYTDASGATANANPVILDANGEADVWFSPVSYKLVLKDANDVVQWTKDNYAGSPYPVTDEWLTYVHTWTFVDGTHVTVPGDQTAIYAANKAIRAVCTAGTYYATITSAVYDGSTKTTLTASFNSGAFDAGVAGSSKISIGVLATDSPAMASAAAAAASATSAAGYASAASGSASAASTSAANAASSASAAAASAASIAGGPVASVNGMTGVVTGVALASDLVPLASKTGVETLTNKSLSDSTTYIVDDVDATKKAQFQVSGISTGTTRTLTIPNKSGTIAMLDDVPATTAPAMILLSTVTASGAATADIETTFDSTYDVYVLVGSSIKSTYDGDTIRGRFKISGAYDTGANYKFHNADPDSSSASYVGVNDSAGNSFNILQRLGNAASKCGDFVMHIFNPASTSLQKRASFTGGSIDETGKAIAVFGHGINTGTGALTGVRIFGAAGNISGTFRLYGIKNS